MPVSWLDLMPVYWLLGLTLYRLTGFELVVPIHHLSPAEPSVAGFIMICPLSAQLNNIDRLFIHEIFQNKTGLLISAY